ncbi:phosphotransferase enzyme family protein [Marinifilum caeruleilacunae]|uniref:Aminoglycoside phosphotransferase family protein n=1 Tax=Marinifilum caeruleilacunae TaxID=2499076 RepID=A0ABX1WUP3_9BACT|nr:aminoglycoside phosphotransferase family protein [Marinifilum caeruleilacunae]NOU59737.1 aminoglycoside phosphotransferase family protein [Marinifilum caeruleilacunae]
MELELRNIASRFQIVGEIASVRPLGEGFINDTFLVKTKLESTPDYLLQRKNKSIFKDVPGMMQNIISVTSHLKEKIKKNGGDPNREAMTIILSEEGNPYFTDSKDDYWTLCLFIKDNISYDDADSPKLAYAGGKGIGKFQAMLADLKEPLTDILPGFHNIRFRFEQWDEVLDRDPLKRKKDLEEEISWIEERRNEMLEFWELVEEGIIPARVTHNDTKINNILFDRDGKDLCVIDLDTVLNSTVLNDFGDAIRSYTNTGLEDDENLEQVSMDMEMFKAYTKGYLEESMAFLSEKEIEYLAFSARYITFEQVLRFLMDYIDGDNYYKTKSPQHNLIRTHAQYKLLRSMEDQFDQMNEEVMQFCKELSA